MSRFQNVSTPTESDLVTHTRPLWGVANNSFFEGALPEKLGFGRANRPQAGSNTEKLHPCSTIHKSPYPQLFGEVQGEP